jgi:hypothetical protein
VLVAGCAGVKPFAELSPKEKSLFFHHIYIAQYDDYQALTADPTLLTEAQKTMLREKRKILLEAGFLIGVYDSYIESGVMPPDAIGQKLYDLINKLMLEGTL